MEYFFVYILRCSDNSYYIGHTDNLEKRLEEHVNRLVGGYTSSRLPVVLVFHQAFSSRDEAFAIERQLKGWSRKKKEALINRDFKLLPIYAKKNNYNSFNRSS